MYTLYKFHFLNGISEINQLFDDILIMTSTCIYIYIYIYQPYRLIHSANEHKSLSAFSGCYCICLILSILFDETP